MIIADHATHVVFGLGTTGVGVMREHPVMELRSMDRVFTGAYDPAAPDSPKPVHDSPAVFLQFQSAEAVDNLVRELEVLKRNHFSDNKKETI